ncbi:MAG: hypothetical protein PHE55_16235 [Methylococcaceae bacterium]|nr:hypothetical protein [Methylococcaceae bacterium]
MYTQFPAYERGGAPEASQYEAIYQDGAWAHIYMSMGHACGETKVMSTSPRTTQVAIVIPGNNSSAQEIDYPLLDGNYSFPKLDPAYKVLGPASPDVQGNDWGISVAQSEGIAALSRTYTFYAEKVPVYEKAPRAAVWVGDGVPSYNEAQIVFWAQLPEIPATSCVTDVQYFFAAAQFCPKSKIPGALPVQAWLLGATNNWPVEHLGGAPDQWAPYLRMRRDIKAKPLPDSCGGKGQIVSVYPSKEEIDTYLKPVSESKNGNAHQISVQEWISKHK